MQKKAIFLLILAAVTGCTHLPLVIDEDSLADFQSTTLPLVLVGRDNLYPAIDLEILGQTLRLDVDTGAASATIHLQPQVLQQLDVQWTGRLRFFSNLTGRIVLCREYIIPYVELGSLKLHNVYGYEDRNPPLHESDGIIGLELLGRFNVLLDYSRGELVLYPPGTEPDFLDAAGWFRYQYTDGYAVSIDDTGAAAAFGLDACSSNTIIDLNSSLGQTLFASFGLIEEDGIFNQWSSGLIYVIDVEHLWLDSYDLGPEQVVLMDYPDRLTDGILGAAFHHKHRAFFDYSREVVWIRKY